MMGCDVMEYKMTVNIVNNAELICRLLCDCEDFQASSESEYKKEHEKISVYEHIMDLVRVKNA